MIILFIPLVASSLVLEIMLRVQPIILETKKWDGGDRWQHIHNMIIKLKTGDFGRLWWQVEQWIVKCCTWKWFRLGYPWIDNIKRIMDFGKKCLNWSIRLWEAEGADFVTNNMGVNWQLHYQVITRVMIHNHTLMFQNSVGTNINITVFIDWFFLFRKHCKQ